MKKIISLLLSLCIVATLMNFSIINVTAADSDETTLFSDDFEDYATGIPYNASTYGKYWDNMVSANEFRLFAGLGTTAAATLVDGFSSIADPAKIMQIVSKETSGIGTGNSLMVTAQSQAKSNQLIRKSGITSEKVNDKRIVFTTTFKVPTFVGAGDAVSVNLAIDDQAANNYIAAPSSGADIYKYVNKNDKAGELIFLGARWESGRGMTAKNELWTFGEKVADLTAGEEYTYSVIMTPNETTGKYDVETDLNGTKLTLGQAEYTASSTIPTIEEVLTYGTIRVMRQTHVSSFGWGYCGNNLSANIANNTLGVTTAEGKYDNNRAVAYFDDMSLKAVEIEDTVFEDDFEDYELGELANRGVGYSGKNTATLFDVDTFAWMCGKTTDYSADNTLKDWIKSTAIPADAAVIAENTGVGEGNTLKITGQLGIGDFSLAKKSNINTSVASRTMEFHADFKAPISGVRGEGFGIWVLADTAEQEPKVQYLSSNKDIVEGTGSFIKGEFMYIGSREDLRVFNKTDLGSRATYLYVFGEKVARLNPDAIYDLKVILKPNESGSYTGAVVLNGTTYSLAGTNMPTQAEFATYKRLYATPISRAWSMHNGGGEIWYAETRPSDMIDENGYIMGRTIGILDNISLTASNTIELPTADTAVNMKAIDTDWTSKGTSFVNALATVNGTTATVEIRSDRSTEYTPYIIVAAYDSNDAMTRFVSNNTTVVPSGGIETVTFTGLPEDYAYIKVFVWDSMENLKPVTECCSLTYTNNEPEQDEEEPEPEADEVIVMYSVKNADAGILGKKQDLS